MSYVIDSQSGTFFDADHARVVHEDQLGEHYADILDNGSDAERAEMAEELGRSVIADHDALDAIAKLIRERGTFASVIDIVRGTGREVA